MLRVCVTLHSFLRERNSEPKSWKPPTQANQTWSLDFMKDSLTNRHWLRTLNILDNFNREAPWIEADTSLPVNRVISILENPID